MADNKQVSDVTMDSETTNSALLPANYEDTTCYWSVVGNDTALATAQG